MTHKTLTLSCAKIAFPLIAALCLTPYLSGAWALMLGIALALTLGNPYSDFTKQMTHRLLQLSIIGLGAGMNLSVIGQVGAQGVGYTAVGIALTMLIGLILGRILKIQEATSLLITVGTAICGGSAIAAVASTIRARSHDVSVALATVFFLNATALFIFPSVGHYFQMSEVQFGLWSALATHDTSSVVGSAIQYGPQAVEIATTVKLARALWIIPVSLIIGMIWNRKKKGEAAGQVKRPWFILGFLIAAAVVTWVPSLQPLGNTVSLYAKRGLVLTLFLIGTGLTRATVETVGPKPFFQGFCLWILMASATLSAILLGWIQ